MTHLIARAGVVAALALALCSCGKKEEIPVPESAAETAATPQGSLDYEIRLSHPMQPGERYHVTVAGYSLDTKSLENEGKPPVQEAAEFNLEFDAAATIQEIDELGRCAKASLVMEKWSYFAVQGKAPEERIAPGTVVTASSTGGKEVYDVDGKPASPQLAKALSLAGLLTKGGPAPDEVFGAKERKEIGASWPVNRARAAQSFRGQMGGVKEEDVAGTTTLANVVRVGDKEWLQVQSELTVRQIAASAPAGLSMGNSGIQVHMRWKEPVGPLVGDSERTMEAQGSLEASTGAGAKMRAGYERRATVSLTKLE